MHFTVKAYIASEVEQHAVEPVVSVETFRTVPRGGGISPLRPAFGVEVEDEHVPAGYGADHRRAGIGTPGLYYPLGSRAVALHGGVDGLACSLEIDPGRPASLVEWIHAVEAGLAEEFFRLLVVDIGYFLEILIFRLQECGTVISLPQSRVRDIQPQALCCVVRQHSGVSGQDRLDSQLCHAGEDVLLQFSIAGVP